MNGLSDVDEADVSVVCGADATADGSDVGSASYVDGEANIPVFPVTSVVCCVDVSSVSGSFDDEDADVSVVCGAASAADGTEVGSTSYNDGEVNVTVVSDANVDGCVDVTSVNGLSDVGGGDVSVVCGADATADGTDVGSVSYVDGEANVSVVSDTNVVCCVDPTPVTGSSDVGDADVSVVCVADATADGTDVGSVSYSDGDANVSAVPDTNVICCVVGNSVNCLSDVGDADVAVVCGADATANGTDVGTVSSVDSEAKVPVVSAVNVVVCVDVASVTGSSDNGRPDVWVV